MYYINTSTDENVLTSKKKKVKKFFENVCELKTTFVISVVTNDRRK